VGILVALTVVQVLFWRGLITRPPAPSMSGGRAGGSGRDEGLVGLAEVTVDTIAGQPQAGYRDGPRGSALFDGPAAVAAGEDGSIYVADSRNHCLRVISPAGMVTTLAGRGGEAGRRDGAREEARFRGPAGLAVGRDGSLLVADTGNHRICQVSPAGAVLTLAGAPTPQDELGREVGGYRDGPAAHAEFRYPVGLVADGSGAVYVADAGNHCVRRIAGGEVTTLPLTHGHGPESASGGTMESPTVLALMGDQLLVSDTSAGKLWGGPREGPLRPWQPTDQEARMKPAGLALISGDGGWPETYVADADGHCIRRLEGERPGLVAGTGDPSPPGWQDGSGDMAQFSCPAGMAAGRNRTIYLADFGNNCIRRLRLAGAEGGPARGD